MFAEVKASGYRVKEFLSDNECEFDYKSVNNILKENGIKQRPPCRTLHNKMVLVNELLLLNSRQ